MKRFASLLFMGAMLFMLGYAPPSSAQEGKLGKILSHSNVIVGGSCSGTFIGNNTILTAAHCIKDAYEFKTEQVLKDDGTVEDVKKYYKVPLSVSYSLKDDKGNNVGKITYIARVMKRNNTHDLALLETESFMPHLTSVAFAAVDPKLGENVWIVGNPAGLENTVTRGIVSALKREIKGIPRTKFLQISGGIFFGNSGGGVFNEEGDLIGVAVRVHPQATHLGLAVDTDIVRKFINND